MKKILICFLILIFCIGFVSASENTTDIQTSDADVVLDNGIYNNELSLNSSKIFVNNSKETNGDGSSWDNAHNSIPYVEGNETFYLSEGNYTVVTYINKNYTFIGLNNNTVIKDINHASCYFNLNSSINFINLTFKSDGLKNKLQSDGNWYSYNYRLDGTNFNFTNCNFINSTIIMNLGIHVNNDRYVDVFETTFNNCNFIDYDGEILFKALLNSRVVFNNCIFNNISADSIIDSYGAAVDNSNRVAGTYIYNSSFSNCTINGIIKGRQLPYCSIINCSYDFNDIGRITGGSPFYMNATNYLKANTEISVVVNNKNIVITLFEIDSSKPLYDAELTIIDNGNKKFDYTDINGQIILNNLVGNHYLEILYRGDDVYHPTSLNKTFTFKPKINTVLTVNNINTVYNTAKKWTFILKDVNNNVLANKKVTVKLDKNYEVTTNNKGQAVLTLPTNLVPKTYTATITFAGDNNYNKVSTTAKVIVSKATPKLTTKKLTTKVKVKTKKVTATLKGVPKNTKVTLKLKGKTYTAKTNKKGIATFKVTKLNKKGTFKGTVKFAGNKYFKAVSKSVQIKVK